MEEILYLIRTTGDKPHYFSGSGMYAVPKLYKIGDAKRVVRKENKFVKECNRLHKDDPARYPYIRKTVEAVPVTFTLGDPVTFEE